jgi:hypothetical protein
MRHDAADAAAAHALNALPPDEADRVDAAISSNRRLAANYDAFRRVAATLADGFPEAAVAAPGDLWDRIAGEAFAR